MQTEAMEKLILLHMTPETWWTIDALRQRIMELRIDSGDWPLKAYFLGFLFGTKVALHVGGVPTPIYFNNAFEALESKGEVIYEKNKGWKITKIGLNMQRLYHLEDAEEEREQTPTIH